MLDDGWEMGVLDGHAASLAPTSRPVNRRLGAEWCSGQPRGWCRRAGYLCHAGMRDLRTTHPLVGPSARPGGDVGVSSTPVTQGCVTYGPRTPSSVRAPGAGGDVGVSGTPVTQGCVRTGWGGRCGGHACHAGMRDLRTTHPLVGPSARRGRGCGRVGHACHAGMRDLRTTTPPRRSERPARAGMSACRARLSRRDA
ncbi:MAG: hypothetical protein KatS3mg050_0814 [Litorilinea sp.]|nr:MAG: hypothetical protein KatS3mg050_0814 [Litorilinea sp.]